MNRTISRILIQEAIDTAGLTGEVTLYADHEGRGMYGSSCFGLVGSTGDIARVVFHLGYAAAQDDAHGDGRVFPDLYSMLDRWTTDNMGHDTIAYFPGWTLED